MHPEIVRDGPGSCPICGMALEPMTPAAGEAENPELRDMTRRFWVGVGAVGAAAGHGDGRACRRRHARCADRAHSRSGCSWRSRRRSCCGAAGRSSSAAGQSLRQPPPEHVHADRARHRRRLSLQPRRDARARHLPGLVPRPEGGVPVYFEAAAVIVTLVLLGQVLELRARSQTIERDPRAARPRAEDAPASSRDDGGEADVAARSGACPAIVCACGPARRCRSTASSSKGTARSTNR